VKIPIIGKKEITVAFIRAPKILSVGKSVEILAKFEDVPVLVRQGNVWGMSFHPEITGEIALHKFIFLK
jgi:5'-phosphate synthase pdxT subunit